MVFKLTKSLMFLNYHLFFINSINAHHIKMADEVGVIIQVLRTIH